MYYVTNDSKEKVSFGRMLDIMYPVGSIYQTTSTSPQEIFDELGIESTWEKLEDVFLLSSGTREVGATGGEETHTLTTSEIPSHSHSYTNYPNTGTRGYDISSSSGLRYGSATSQTTGSTGDGGAHNNMPPYYVVDTYIRTA